MVSFYVGLLFFLQQLTINSNFMDLACHVSFQVFILKNLFSIVFTHFITNSISFLCLVVVVVVTTPSCQMVVDFISSTTQVNVFSMKLKLCCEVAKTPFIFFSYVWLFSSSC